MSLYTFEYYASGTGLIVNVYPGQVATEVPTARSDYALQEVNDAAADPPTPRIHVFDATVTPQKYRAATASEIDQFDVEVAFAYLQNKLVKAALLTAMSVAAQKHHIILDLSDARVISANAIGDIVGAGTNPVLERVNGATDKAMRLKWVAGNTTEIQWSFPYPQNQQPTGQSLTIYVLANMSGATDAPTLAIGYFQGLGDTNRGGNTGAAPSTFSLATQPLSFAISPIGDTPTMATVTLTPGAHATDALYVYGIWAESEPDLQYSNHTPTVDEKDWFNTRLYVIYKAETP